MTKAILANESSNRDRQLLKNYGIGNEDAGFEPYGLEFHRTRTVVHKDADLFDHNLYGEAGVAMADHVSTMTGLDRQLFEDAYCTKGGSVLLPGLNNGNPLTPDSYEARLARQLNVSLEYATKLAEAWKDFAGHNGKWLTFMHNGGYDLAYYQELKTKLADDRVKGLYETNQQVIDSLPDWTELKVTKDYARLSQKVKTLRQKDWGWKHSLEIVNLELTMGRLWKKIERQSWIPDWNEVEFNFGNTVSQYTLDLSRDPDHGGYRKPIERYDEGSGDLEDILDWWEAEERLTDCESVKYRRGGAGNREETYDIEDVYDTSNGRFEEYDWEEYNVHGRPKRVFIDHLPEHYVSETLEYIERAACLWDLKCIYKSCFGRLSYEHSPWVWGIYREAKKKLKGTRDWDLPDWAVETAKSFSECTCIEEFKIAKVWLTRQFKGQGWQGEPSDPDMMAASYGVRSWLYEQLQIAQDNFKE